VTNARIAAGILAAGNGPGNRLSARDNAMANAPNNISDALETNWSGWPEKINAARDISRLMVQSCQQSGCNACRRTLVGISFLIANIHFPMALY